MTRTTRWSTVVTIGVAVALTLGFFAFLATDDRKVLTFVVFAVMTAPVCIGAAWAFFTSEKNAPPTHPEDTVETEWSRKAGLGAFSDLICAMGIALTAHYVFGAPEVPLPAFLALGMADFGIRYFAATRAHR
ncbi:hypothetical protein ABH922_003909 [Rhodococcus sp. 27YEA15]|uniref:hypothetical protein n=1 Tax=Rhodococcus sp. 27YEA15 TaxID=3156259 RepID=UPI003C7CA2A7